MYNASAGLAPPSSFDVQSNALALHLCGFAFDNVVSVDSASILLDHASKTQPYEHAHCSKLEALVTTASADVYSRYIDMHARTSEQSPQTDASGLDLDLSSQMLLGSSFSSSSWSMTILKILPDLKETIANRTLFTTSLGYVGLGSDRMRAGDMVCIIAGAQLPLVLRSVDDAGENEFEYCGEAYVHGVMDGEAVKDEKANGMRSFVVR
ncbi:Uu.00g049250.m01.CDS01 [Anthostomella pinea]|uniref:Uu.00g049250.m01.CDS01 n=1 Tax=Anthostomella pinea TaxID=933095 RepID=A0AAI8VCE7_9PEZI|nr:Uu.00g049250.m01.CDS01 [Anthostomella pinea]